MEDLQQIIKKLPQHIQDILYSDEYLARFQAITEAFGLNIEMSGRLMEELVYVMAGLTHPDDFVKEIQKELSLDREQAEKITREIDEKILKSIKADLIKIYDGEEVENPRLKAQDSNTIDDSSEENMDRDSLLSEIENPKSAKESTMTEVIQNTEIDNNEMHNTSQENLLKEMENPKPVAPRGDLVGDKLKAPMNVPKKKVEVDETKGDWKQPIDPYREAIE